MPTMMFLYDASVLKWFVNTVKNFMKQDLLSCTFVNSRIKSIKKDNNISDHCFEKQF